MWKFLREELGWAGPALLVGLGVSIACVGFGLILGLINGNIGVQIVLRENQALWAAVAVAVLVPIGIEALQLLRERGQTRQKIKAIGFTILPALLYLETSIRSLPQTSLALKMHAKIWRLGQGRKLEIEIPESLRIYLTDFHLMGDLGHDLVQMYAVVEQFNMINKRAEEARNWEPLAGHIHIMNVQINSVMLEMEKIHP